MAQIKWIKLDTGIFDDDKMILLQDQPSGDKLMLLWIRLLCLAGRINDGGIISDPLGESYSIKTLSRLLRKPQKLVSNALLTFADFGLIEITDHGIRIVNWGKHQNISTLDRIRETNREKRGIAARDGQD